MKLTTNLDKIGTLGLFLTALASPCCFPLFGFMLTAFGLGSFELFGEKTMWIFQGLVLLSLIGSYYSFRQHKNTYPLSIALAAAALILYAYHFDNADDWTTLLYVGMFGLLFSSGLNYYFHRKQKVACSTCTIADRKSVALVSVITCPNCGHKKAETMPTDACQFFLSMCKLQSYASLQAGRPLCLL